MKAFGQYPSALPDKLLHRAAGLGWVSIYLICIFALSFRWEV